MKNKNSVYLILSVILVILSIIAGLFLFNLLQQRNLDNSQPSTSNKIALIPTDSPQQLIDDLSQDDLLEASPTAKISPTKVPSKAPTKIPTPTTIPTLVPTSAPSSTTTFTDTDKTFSLKYNSSRVLYQDNTSLAKRYTFYLPTSSFALHIASDGGWAWTNPSRQFTDTFTVADQPTFRYDIKTQTIVDLQFNDMNYTLQCVHNGKEALMTECEQFIESFDLL
jgi:hypothetical protein